MLGFSRLSLFPSYTVAGLVSGGLYALTAIGFVLIYRVSGVLNFAHGAVAMFATFVAYQVAVRMGLPAILGMFAAILTGVALGYIIERFTIRPLAGRPPLAKVVVTIGWLLVLQTAAGQIWGDTAYHEPVELVSRNGFKLPGISLVIGYNQIIILIVALVLSLAMAALLKWTIFGVSMRAVADDPSSARLWGISVNRVTSASWMTGSALGAIAGVLITPQINFTTYSLTLIVIDALTAALIGRLQSLPMTVFGALLLGLAQAYPRLFFTTPGVSELATFILVIGTLLILFRPGARKVRLA